MADPMMDPSRSATTLVLTCPELLTLILQHLPPLHLLLAQRVSPIWHSLITTCPHLQRLLFFRPDWSLSGTYSLSKPGARPLNNLLLRRVMAGTYPTMTLRMLHFPSEEAFLAAKERLTLPSCPLTLPEKQDELGFWAWSVNVSLPSEVVAMGDAAVAYEKASWRRMLLCQPPATELHLCRRWRRAETPAVVREEGITMGDLLDAAEQGKRSWNEVFISSDRDWHLEGVVRYSRFVES